MVTVITAILEVLAHIIMYAAKAIALAAKVGAKTAQVAGKVTVETGKVAVKAGKAGAKVAKTGIKAGTKVVKQGAKVAKKGAKVAKQGVKTVKKGTDIARKGANVAKKGVDTTIKAGRTVKDTAENSARLAMSATQGIKDFANATEEEKVKKALKLGAKTGLKALELAKKATFLAAKAVWTFLKIVTKVIALMYATVITGIAFTILLFIGAVSIIVILMANSGIGMIPGVSFDGGNQDSGYVQPSNPSNPDNPDVPVNPQVAGDCITALQTMANWYLANVTTYQAGPITNGNRTRKNYSCPLMPYKPTVGDDCSAFAAAYASLVSGVKVDDYGSGTWIKPNAPSLISAGWTPLYTNDIGGISGLQPGDILVCNPNCTYAVSKGHHCEVYIASGQSFGWGKVQSKYPSSTTTLVNKLVQNKTTGANDYIAISSGGHDYVLVWRFTGGN